MVRIKAVKKVTVTEQIMEQIATLIRSGELQPGEQLPTERDLAVQFGVTRGRVREALRALSLVGLITIKAGEGSFVNKQEEPIPSETIVWMFHNELSNLDEVYAARKLIETEVYAAAARNTEALDSTVLSDILASLNRKAVQAAPETFLELLDRFDLYVGEICGNRIYTKLMQTIVYLRNESSLKLLRVPGAMASSIQTRTALLEALNSSSVDNVNIAMERFFTNARQFYEQIGKM